MIGIGPTAGTGTPTRDYDIGATDLCEFMEFPSGILQVCGDSFAGRIGFGPWHAPIALHVETESIDDQSGVRYDRDTGNDKPLLADPTPAGMSQLPAGVVQINRENYLLVTTVKDLVPQSSRLVKANPAQGNWPTVPNSQRPSGYADARQSQISGYYDPIPTADSPSGWVYIVANNFDRSGPAVLYRSKPQTFTDRASWPRVFLSGRVGQAADAPVARPRWRDERAAIDGNTVLSYFNASTGNIEVRVAADPTGVGAAPVTTVVFAGTWPDPAEIRPRRRTTGSAQPYGGYISPGSTLDESCGCSSASGTPVPATTRHTASSSSP